jgi:hypothetical protein
MSCKRMKYSHIEEKDVPNSSELKNTVLREMHNVPYVEHPGYQKANVVVRSHYFWLGMKKEVTNYIAICLEY